MNKLVRNTTTQDKQMLRSMHKTRQTTLQHQPELSEVIAVQGEQDFPQSCISLDLNWYL